MTDPKRWTDGAPSRPSLEQRVLSAGRELEPPTGLEERMWSTFGAAVAASTASAASESGSSGGAAGSAGSAAANGSATAGSGALWSVALKPLGAGVVVGLLGAGASVLVEGAPDARDESRVSSRTTDPVARTGPSVSQHSAAELPSEAPTPTPSSVFVPSITEATEPQQRGRWAAASSLAHEGGRAGAPPPTSRSTGAESSAPVASFPVAPPAASTLTAELRQNTLKAEALELARAENLLAEGRAQQAEDLLAASARRFPSGALVHERELLYVDALHRLGKTELSRRRARAFLTQFPASPLASKMRRFAGLE